MALIPISGIPSSYRTPGSYAEVLFAQGPGTSSAGIRSVIFPMPMSAAGTWTVNTVYEVKNEGVARDGAGVGSPLHRGLRAFLKRNKTAKVYALPYAATSGGSPVAATGTITYATTATGIGSTVVTICGEQFSVKINTGDTPTVIGANIASYINAKEYLPVTAVAVTGVVTLTARIAGASQGTATVGVIRFRAIIVGSIGTTVATSGACLGFGTGVPGADGATTEAANLATALATVRGSRNYYMVFSVNDATSLGNVKSHISQKSAPNPGLRSVGISAWTGTSATGVTLSQTLNYERQQIVWQLNGEQDHAELAAAMAASRQQKEELDASYNFDGFRDTAWAIPSAFAVSDWPTSDDCNDAINGGLTPIGSDAAGSYVVMQITTRSKNAAGTVADFRAAETHRISVMDLFTDTLLLRYALNYANKKLSSDQLLSNGTVNPNQKLSPNVITPFTFAPFIRKIIDEFGTSSQLQDTDASKASLQVVRDPSNTGRLECACDLRSIDLLHQGTFRLAEVSPG